MEAREDCVKMVRLPSPLYIGFWDKRWWLVDEYDPSSCSTGRHWCIDIFDTDRSGSINFMEFEGLYRYIKVGLLLHRWGICWLYPPSRSLRLLYLYILNSNTSILVVSPFSSLHFIRILPPLAFSLPTTGLARYLPPFRQRRLRNNRSKRITRRSARIRILITSRDGQKARKTIRTTPTTWSWTSEKGN